MTLSHKAHALKIMPMAVFLVLLFSLIEIASLSAQSSQITRVPTSSRNNGQSNNPRGYVEYLPANYNSRDDWPVLIWHHGLGEGGSGSFNDLNGIANRQIMNWLKNNDVPFIVLAPQDNNGYFGAGRMEAFYNWVKRAYQNKSNPNAYHVSVLSASGAGLITFVESNNLAAKEVATFTVNGALTGVGSNAVYNNIVNNDTKVWFHHGENDGTVPYGAPLNLYRGLLNIIGGQDFSKYRYTLYSGLGHSAWEEVYDNSGRTRSKVTGNIDGGNYGSYYNWTSESWYDWMLNNAKDGSQAPPIADAGSNITLNLPANSTNLVGSGSSSGGSISSYIWSKLSGPATFTLSNQNTATATLSNLVEGTYTFRLTVTDNLGQTGTDDVTVTVTDINQSPIAQLGEDFSIILPVNSVSIPGTASDPDGTIASRVWTKRSGPAATLSGINSGALSATNLVEGTYVFRFTVTDNDGASAFDEIRVTVNPAEVNNPPIAAAGPDRTINLPTNSLTISGSGSDSDGNIVSYLWEKIEGGSATLSNVSNSTFSVSNLQAGIYRFQLTVTDDDGAVDQDVMILNVVAANQNPTANAGNDINITLPTNSTTINGSGSDNDGTITSFSWVQTAGPGSSTLANASTANLTVSGLIAGTYTFRLTVTDDDGAEASDLVNIIVSAAPPNISPTAFAGPDRTITLPVNSLVLNGSGTDSDGTIVTYLWTKVSGPASFTILNTGNPTTTIDNLVEGSYTFRLRVTDNNGATNSDNVVVNVLPEEVNQSPTANAGANRSITLPNNSISITGSASDPDGTVVTSSWTQINGPSTATLSGANTLNLNISNLVEGIYNFRLRVEDNDGAIDTDDVRVTVNSENQSPEVSAGPDRVITLPQNTLIITGTASDPDGTIAQTEWVQTAGLAPTINQNGLTIELSNLLEGNYEFQLTVTDNEGAEASDRVRITVNGSNNAPIVNAGPDRTISLPSSTINISGSAVDSDGTIAALQWTQLSGTAVNLINPANVTLTVSGLVEGNYSFLLTATDNQGATASDQMNLRVNPATVNVPPSVDAGENQIMYLPVNSTILNGVASDNDGTIVTYEWVKQSGPSAVLANASTSSLTLSDLVVGTYVFRLTVIDNAGASSSDQVEVIVYPEETNQAPVANAGPDKTIVLPVNNANLSGSGSDADGTISSYSWSQVSGPSIATVSNLNVPTLLVSNLIEGTYTFKLTVQDNDGAIDEDEAVVQVLPENTNVNPVANAGTNIDVFLPTNNVNILGSGSDEDGDIVAYRWNKLSGPADIVLTNNTTPVLSVANLKEGIYRFQLEVTDNEGGVGSDEMQLRVFAATANVPPNVDAGANRTIILPVNSINLTGVASDGDGSIASYLWVKTSGGAAILQDIDKARLVVSGLEEGIYNFRLTVTDNSGASKSDEVRVTVLPEFSNNEPKANAGPDRNVKLPVESIIIQGAGTDEDGEITNYFWSKRQGPAVNMINSNEANLELQQLNPGQYLFQLEVTDDQGATGTDDMILIVLPETANINPQVSAGDDISAFVYEVPIVIQAQASDEDGTIENYLWERTGGGENIIFSGENTTILTVNEAEEGEYIFRVSVTDNDGAIASDIVILKIFPDDRVPPPLAIAGNDTTLIFPESNYVLVGLASSENLIATYMWEQLEGPPIAILPADSNVVSLVNLAKGVYRFQLTVTDVEGQEGEDEITVIVKDNDLRNDFPKIFSPNNDGQNDVWLVDDLERISNCSLTIYDSYGREVFAANPYQNNWDGTLNGSPLPAAAYYYVFRCADAITINGGVRIVR